MSKGRCEALFQLGSRAEAHARMSPSDIWTRNQAQVREDPPKVEGELTTTTPTTPAPCLPRHDHHVGLEHLSTTINAGEALPIILRALATSRCRLPPCLADPRGPSRSSLSFWPPAWCGGISTPSQAPARRFQHGTLGVLPRAIGPRCAVTHSTLACRCASQTGRRSRRAATTRTRSSCPRRRRRILAGWTRKSPMRLW